ncbi:6004_t:CDS:2, partial [Gigaspora margarita]
MFETSKYLVNDQMLLNLAQLVQQLRERIRTLEEELERRQEQIVEGVENNWRREVQYERLLRERNRLRTRVEDLEERLQE